MKRNLKEEKHKWELQFVEAQFPSGISDTSTAVEYAYLLCQECIRVKKVEVT